MAIALSVVGACFVALAVTRVKPYVILLSGVGVLLVSGVITAPQALSGLANPGVATIAFLYVVVAGLRESGVLGYVVDVLGLPRSVRRAQLRLIVPVAAASGFINNTPLVAMLMPAVRDWAKRIGISPSKLLILLSYASVLGGMCTLIGTSTNLVVHGLLLENGYPGLGLFDMAGVGLMCTAVGGLFLVTFSSRLLPARNDPMPSLQDAREFTVEMLVEPGGVLAGKTIEAAGLRNLPGCFLVEIHRHGRVLAAIGPQQTLEDGDQLVFVGLVESVVDLQRTNGLLPATEQVFKLDVPRAERWFVEAVVSHRCPVVGRTIRDAEFRSRYNAVVLAVARGGERINQKIGDIELEQGDVLLLEALPSFVSIHRNSSDFYLVSRASDSAPPIPERAGLAVVTFAAMILCAAVGILPFMQAAMIAAAIVFFTRTVTEATARRAIDWQVLLTIAAAFGLAAGLERSGAANALATLLISATGGQPWLTFAAVCVSTTLVSELLSNNAAAALMFPIAMQAAHVAGVSPAPFAIGLALSASAAFATPIGYQTHLMVYGAGGYRFGDFVRVGVPMDLLILATIIGVTPILIPF